MDLGVLIPIALYFAIALFLLFLYFWPSYLAFRKGHPHCWWILLVNLIFGWSAIGWFAVLFWAFRGGDTDDTTRAFTDSLVGGRNSVRIAPRNDDAA